MSERKLIRVPPLRKKGRSLVELGPDSLAAALAWNERAAAVAPADPAPVEPVPSSGRVETPAPATPGEPVPSSGRVETPAPATPGERVTK